MIDQIIHADWIAGLQQLPDQSVNCCITSPPYYGLRDYGVDGQLGLEETPELFIKKLVAGFREVRRVLLDDGTLWVNIGDSYARNPSKGGSGPGGKNGAYSDTYTEASKVRQFKPRNEIKEKDLIGIPWMLAFALRSDGWYLRQEIIWHKPNPMPESVTDRCTKSHEHIFLLSKSPQYYFDSESIKTQSQNPADDARRYARQKSSNKSAPDQIKNGIRVRDTEVDTSMANKRSVWTVNTHPFKDAHFATFPEKLVVDMIKAGCPEGGVVLDPFFGAGTTGLVARKLNRHFVGIELNADYITIATKRLHENLGLFA